ncbi:MAG TPA: adenylate/guanylate cyclase domain-containing protein [Gaiellaceae bacterium]|nr:adenylate/guanylate cyclase domain-containing protein [Gaiellaceae bacterium]
MAELPTGTVTFLFTDIEGSTRLLNELGDAYADVLAEHRRILRDAFTAHGGVEVDTQGDAFFVAFARATDAAAAAAESQRGLADRPVRVRMGIHTGEPIRTDEGYAGMDVHRAARIAAVGHGGQVLVSQTSRDLLGDQVELRDLGAHRLKDLTQAQRIYQLGDGGFPPLKSLQRTNLPITATALVGRELELTELCGLLGNGTRLVTLTGAGGSGKTRLALQVAAELSDAFGDGVFFVPLAPVQDAELVGATIEQAVGVRELAELREAEALLVLDNMEHLLASAATVSALLGDARRVKLLATSRAPLRVSGEQEYALDPLRQEEAVELFLERARSARRDVVYDEAVPEICRRLDGLPLALELAASRVKVLDPSLLLDRLERRLPLLTGGARDAPERQQTLRATIDWSYGLLEEPLQEALRRLSVFAGSFSLEAAESVTETGLEQLAELIDWSLVKPSGEGRFFMLETIREYAAEQLELAGEHARLRGRHLDFFLAFAIEAEPELTGPRQADWFHRVELDQPNIREALAHACEVRDAERAQMLSGTVWRFWLTRGQIDEASRWYERALALGGDVSPKAHARAVFGSAHMTEVRGDTAQTMKDFEEVVEALRVSEEFRWLILALNHLGAAYVGEGEAERADRPFAEALALARETGDVRGEGITLSNMGWRKILEEDYADAEELQRQAVEILRSIDDAYGVASGLFDLSALALRQGEVDAAAEQIVESMRLMRSINDVVSLTHALPVAAAVVLALGHADVSARLCSATRTQVEGGGFELDRVTKRYMSESTESARAALGDGFDGAWAAGAELEIEEAVELALTTLEAT